MDEIREQRLDLVASASVDVNVLVLFVSQFPAQKFFASFANFCQLYFRLYQA